MVVARDTDVETSVELMLSNTKFEQKGVRVEGENSAGLSSLCREENESRIREIVMQGLCTVGFASRTMWMWMLLHKQ